MKIRDAMLVVRLTAAIALFLVSVEAVKGGEVKTTTVNYTADGVNMRGYLAYPSGVTGRLPAILVFPEWYGLNDYAKHRAEQLAALGYVALAVDMYGEGHVAADTKEAGSLAGALKAGDRSDLKKRAEAALATLKSSEHADPARMGAIGYCFGGTVALELARTGADLRGVAIFHAGLDTPHPAAPGKIRAAILVCHGADDPYAPKATVDAFLDEMRRSGADWQMDFYGDAVHSFTNPAAGNDKSKGAAYNAKADHRSWELMESFFREVLGNMPR